MHGAGIDAGFGRGFWQRGETPEVVFARKVAVPFPGPLSADEPFSIDPCRLRPNFFGRVHEFGSSPVLTEGQ